ncbi:MAG: alpha-galactosidase [Armatimonadetes bacterium]|nr:alpha-galactosidase [Armatimonadota bacterium]
MSPTYLLFLVLLALVASAGAADERPAFRAWVDRAWFGRDVPPPPRAAGLDVRRQDHGEFHLNQSVMNTPLQIGSRHYQRGLGTHAFSEIVVRLDVPAARFIADCGVDHNFDTAGVHGSVEFSVEAGGKALHHSELHRGGMEPLHVDLDLGGAREVVLKVSDGGDGPGWDQCDWCDAKVVLADGRTVWLDELPLAADATFAEKLPIGFTFGGKPAAELLPGWKRAESVAPSPGGELHTLTWTDPASGMELAAEVRTFTDYPAVEWVLRFTHRGAADSPKIEALDALDLGLDAPRGSVVLHHAHGSNCTETDFLPIDTELKPNTAVDLAPVGGRSSDGRLPFFNLGWPGGGLVGAVGWSGQWRLHAGRDQGGPIRLTAGQQTVSLVLHPGESIRSPRILLVSYQGDRWRGHNLLRRVILDHYTPHRDGQPVLPPVSACGWFTYNTGNGVDEANQLGMIDQIAPLGVENYWLDAGWFEGGWPSGVGSWVPRTDAFPRGLRPLGDASRAKGMGFVVWFEPERVHPASRIGKEHAAWVLRSGDGDGLYNLGDPAARQWLTDYLGQCIDDWGITIYRQDFNIDPLRFWQAADAPDRQGMTENQYVQGLYRMWDELLAKHPGLAIDDCSSGGRRIDLETITRSFPLWRSDTQCCGRAMPIWDQTQTGGLTAYLPLSAAGVWSFEPYEWRSICTTGTNLVMKLDAAAFDAERGKLAIAEAKSLRPYYLGDFYPQILPTLSDREWGGWQFDRPDLGAGFALLFRRPNSPYVAVDLALQGLDPDARYEVTLAEDYTPGAPREMSGAELAKLRVVLERAPGAVLVRYRRP